MAQQYRDPASNVFWVINFNWTAGRTDLIMTNTPHWLDTGGYCYTGSNIIIVYRLFWYNCTWTFILEPSGRKCLVGGGGGGDGDMTPWGDIGFHQVTVAGTGVWLPGNILTSHSDQQYPLFRSLYSRSHFQEFYAKYFCLQIVSKWSFVDQLSIVISALWRPSHLLAWLR